MSEKIGKIWKMFEKIGKKLEKIREKLEFPLKIITNWKKSKNKTTKKVYKKM